MEFSPTRLTSGQLIEEVIRPVIRKRRGFLYEQSGSPYPPYGGTSMRKRAMAAYAVPLVVVLCSALGLSGLLTTSAAAQDALTITMKVSPNAIVPVSQGGCVSVHADIAYSAVAPGSVELTIDDDPTVITPYLVFADLQGNLVAKFNLATIKGMVEPPKAEFHMTGELLLGGTFSGTDDIAVRVPKSSK